MEALQLLQMTTARILQAAYVTVATGQMVMPCTATAGGGDVAVVGGGGGVGGGA